MTISFVGVTLNNKINLKGSTVPFILIQAFKGICSMLVQYINKFYNLELVNLLINRKNNETDSLSIC